MYDSFILGADTMKEQRYDIPTLSGEGVKVKTCRERRIMGI